MGKTEQRWTRARVRQLRAEAAGERNPAARRELLLTAATLEARLARVMAAAQAERGAA